MITCIRIAVYALRLLSFRTDQFGSVQFIYPSRSGSSAAQYFRRQAAASFPFKIPLLCTGFFNGFCEVQALSLVKEQIKSPINHRLNFLAVQQILP
jgi:hypothetical protein